MDGSEIRDLARLGGLATSGVTRMIRDTHIAIADRAFRLSGPGARPAKLGHDVISRGVYTTVAGGMRVAATAAGVAMATRAAGRSRMWLDTARGSVAAGALNGAWGDRLAEWRSAVALGMTIRVDDRDVALDRETLAAAYPEATGDLVVFLHGLCESDVAWRLRGEEHWGDARSTHGSRLQAELGATPVYVRYNTGRHVSDNGADLVELLAELVDAWPVEVERLTLVGHSMGGLVIRAACHLGCGAGATWIDLVRRVVYLGSPHLGAPLEVAATAATIALRRLPETRALGNALAGRSVGIKDLRFGDIRADDWADLTDVDAWRPEPAECAPLLPTAEHFYIGATIGRRNDTVAARVLGDALVPWHSASGSGRRRRLALEVDRGRHLGGLNHFSLLNHPRVYGVMREWFSSS